MTQWDEQTKQTTNSVRCGVVFGDARANRATGAAWCFCDARQPRYRCGVVFLRRARQPRYVASKQISTRLTISELDGPPGLMRSLMPALPGVNAAVALALYHW